MNPDNRVIVQITIEDAEKADEAFTILMGCLLYTSRCV